MRYVQGTGKTFDEALAEAVKEAHKEAKGEAITEYTVERIFGDVGGFRGFNLVTVVIKARLK